MQELVFTPSTVVLLLVIAALAVLAVRRMCRKGLCDCHGEGDGACAGCSGCSSQGGTLGLTTPGAGEGCSCKAAASLMDDVERRLR